MQKFSTEDLTKTFPQIEQQVIDYWKENKIFEKSVELRPGENVYSFYDGPPFITGLPHYGSLLPSIAKDLIPRYQTMKGKRVRRVWGWDCHGLPAENKVEEKLGLKGKKDIEKLGIGKFIEECKTYVQDVSTEWNWYIDHIGRWVDFEHAYKTMDLNYMESVLNVFKQIYDKELIYKGTRTSLYCPRDATPISNFEIAMDNSYKEIEDPAVTIKFKLKNKKDTFVLAWTTTPWTLPANRALAVNKNEEYSEVEFKNNKYILASSLVNKFFENAAIISAFKGNTLIGEEYEPLYTFYPSGKNDFKIFDADFVTMNDGTGIVHIAPGFGEDDHRLGKENDLTLVIHVDDEGKITNEVSPWKGIFFKKIDPFVTEDLKNRDLLFKEERIVHNYPVCWRCQTPLLYRVQEAWYLNVETIKDKMIKINQKINWIPEHIKNGRFKKGLESAPDWCISRSRYWGTPIPIWICDKCNERHVIGSLKELQDLSGKEIKDLHRPGIDEVTFKCTKCDGTARRIPEVLDCWFESGSMPFAQLHYPFEDKAFFEKSYPADYIVEYIAQVRGWFYTLHVISTALTHTNAFKNVVVTGVIMGSDGRKMSKLFKNYPDPKQTIEKYGGESLRLLLMGSPLMVGEDFNINEKDIANQVKNILLPLWNSYKYFLTYANMFGVGVENNKSNNIMDKWIQIKLQILINDIDRNLTHYDIPKAVKNIQPFIEDLSTWFIRRSRDRFAVGDKEAINTLYDVLIKFSLATAPVMPFISENIYRNLQFKEDTDNSVHLQNYPDIIELTDEQLKIEKEMALIREASTIGQSIRVENHLKIRQPLALATLGKDYIELKDSLTLEVLADELNVKEIKFDEKIKDLQIDMNLTPLLVEEGIARELIRTIQELRKKSGLEVNDNIRLYWNSEDAQMQNAIEKQSKEIIKITKANILERKQDLVEHETKINDINIMLSIEKDV